MAGIHLSITLTHPPPRTLETPIPRQVYDCSLGRNTPVLDLNAGPWSRPYGPLDMIRIKEFLKR